MIVHIKKILPYLIAIVTFWLVLFILFTPVFLENKVIKQHDTQQWMGAAKSVIDYRKETGKEALWSPSVFSGMPAYLISVVWSNQPIVLLKKVLSLGMSAQLANVFLCMLNFYILLLSFKIRNYLSLIGAVAFGISSFIIIGDLAGHNARIGAIAFVPLLLAGIHLIFEGNKYLGFAFFTIGLSLHLRENHLQITYYTIMILAGYVIVQFVYLRNTYKHIIKILLLLVLAGLLSTGTFFGQLWSTYEYSKYSTRGVSELKVNTDKSQAKALNRDYVFEYSNGLTEPLTLLIPNYLGGSSANLLAQDKESKTYKALINSGNTALANQLAIKSVAYWGKQPLSMPYYFGAVLFFLFVFALLYAEKKWVYWLLSLSVIGVVLSLGNHFKTVNYFLYDYLPGYSKFRSVTFALILFVFCGNLLAMLGLERLLTNGISKEAKEKLLTVFYLVGGFCLLLILFSGIHSFANENEKSIPGWLLSAMKADRAHLLRMDAFRSVVFIGLTVGALFLCLTKVISHRLFMIMLFFLVLVDSVGIDKRLINSESFERKQSANTFERTHADDVVLNDPDHFRVYDVRSPLSEARTSYYHHSLGGYHGAKLRRYQDLFDSCIYYDTKNLIQDAQTNSIDFRRYTTLNMLNAKYVVYGAETNEVIVNPYANGEAWFARSIVKKGSPTEELLATRAAGNRVSVVDTSKFKVSELVFDSSSTIKLVKAEPSKMLYRSVSKTKSLAVFSEVFYPVGWKAFVDGKEETIMRTNYVLRALQLLPGTHTIEFIFEPDSYVIGNKITMFFSWIVLLVFISCTVKVIYDTIQVRR